jgi:alkanesulfonate monooxygenase SsuD/methylene tetrahydromethanopterin reductase-like flavin-dependent oxidoreductase (luciferase family)
MKFSLFNPSPVYGVSRIGEWPVPPELSAPDATTEAIQRSIEISKIADDAGFDYITVAEHHYHPRQLSPNPMVLAAALAQHLHHAGIAVLGATLPMSNPLRSAEELAMLDALTGGKLLVGLFRGTPTEYLTYGTNPAETRDAFEEAVSLLLQAWTQPEPFSWVGRHYDYRVVAVWPRPVTAPHPPILVSAHSEASALHAAKNRFKAGFAFQPPGAVAKSAGFYREAAEQHGWTPEPDDQLYRSFCLVAETDEEAEELAARYAFGDMSQVFQSHDPDVSAAIRQAMMGGGGGAPQGRGRDGVPPSGSRPTFIGSPATVARQISEVADMTGVGHFDLLFNDVVLPFEEACRGVRMFGSEVMPRLNDVMANA